MSFQSPCRMLVKGRIPGPDAPHWCGWFHPSTRRESNSSGHPLNSGVRSLPSMVGLSAGP